MTSNKHTRHLILIGAALLWSSAALAQAPTKSKVTRQDSQAAPNPTHHPESLTKTGRRKPRGATLDERAGTSPLLKHHDKELQDHTLKSVCQGSSDCKGGHRRR